ncbi:MAG: hypothetical protein M1816_006385 [Peltula sp. TS41687]|nr:MAG: hypothetical protein M1816_006385 [Peltula sp. TS41687]
MASSEDLINLDVIETHKENIQSLPGGRSAKALASVLSPPLSSNKQFSTVLSDTTNLNATIRQGFEAELLSISEADDPLDIYDRYVKWTLEAYPSAQATPQSQLLPLLERATKAFLASSHYKNDPRYLRLWLHFIRLFSDSPKETFAFLARHNVGDALALFYEEFAAWLEGAGRWTQAEEVYMLGIDREARPVERLARKFAEFQQRSAHVAQTGTGPSSPVLAAVRPALAAKMDPFATSSSRDPDPQARANTSQSSREPASKPGRQKLEIFSDADAPPPAIGGEPTKGWQNIGSIAQRKKENVMEPKPWAGETLKAGKKVGTAPKMMIFKDEMQSSTSTKDNEQKPNITHATRPTNSKTGKVEQVSVNLEAVYPASGDAEQEMSFEELRAMHRGWMGRTWSRETNHRSSTTILLDANHSLAQGSVDDIRLPDRLKLGENHESHGDEQIPEEIVTRDSSRGKRSGRSRILQIMEVRSETQTIKANLDSPTRHGMKRKGSTEPTMTLHTRAATEEIYNIFNQPLKTQAQLAEEATSGAESEDEEDDYASVAESTVSGKLDARSEADGEEPEEYTASEWSEFTTRKHLPDLDRIGGDETTGNTVYEQPDENLNVSTRDMTNVEDEQEGPLTTFTFTDKVSIRPTYIPLPPVDYEAPTGTYRDILQQSQSQIPLLTPIVERTESSLASSAAKESETRSYTKTPWRTDEEVHSEIEDEHSNELMSSPLQEIINEAVARHKLSLDPVFTKSVKHKTDGFQTEVSIPSKLINFDDDDDDDDDAAKEDSIIQERICNPTDETLRGEILDNLEPGLDTYHGFFDRRDRDCGKGNEIRKFIKSTKSTKSHDRHSTSTANPPILRFKGTNKEYTIKRELGQGAFAPVYLVEISCTVASNAEDQEGRRKLEAIKMEETPSAWEFYIMRQARQRLRHDRAVESIISVHELHLFHDEVYLIEEYRDQGTLLDLVNSASSPSFSSSAANNTTIASIAALDESLTIFFTIELFRTIEALHAHGILHGDLKPDNCLLRLSGLPSHTHHWSTEYQPDGSQAWSHKGISLIDFGRGIDLHRFPPGTAFKANWPASLTDCPELREGRPWTFQIDYHGLAGIVHTMLFGKYMNTTTTTPNNSSSSSDTKHYRPAEKFKRYWQVELWTAVFDLLLNPSTYAGEEEDGKMPLLSGMRDIRERLEEWLCENAERKGLRAALARVEEGLARERGERERGRKK